MITTERADLDIGWFYSGLSIRPASQARIRQPASRTEGIAELEQIQKKAAELTMPQLAAQAAA